MFARWEWIVIELLVFGLLTVELVRTRRAIRRDREKARKTAGRAPYPPTT